MRNREEVMNADIGHGSPGQNQHEEDSLFTVSCDCLVDMVEARSLDQLRALGGVQRLAQRLETNCSTGLSAAETFPHHLHTKHRAPNCEQSCKLHRQRRAAFGINRLPKRTSTTLIQLMLRALNDRVLIILSIVAVISVSLGLYQSFGQPHAPGQPRVEWVDGITIVTAVAIVVVASALNDYRREQQFRQLNKKVSESLSHSPEAANLSFPQ